MSAKALRFAEAADKGWGVNVAVFEGLIVVEALTWISS